MVNAWSYAKVKSVFMRKDFNEQIVTVSLGFPYFTEVRTNEIFEAMSQAVGLMCRNGTIPGGGIKKVVFSKPATIVLWNDGSKTVVKCQEGDEFSEETGLALAIAKKSFGNTGAYNKVFKEWCGKETKNGD